jgi:hypothetical protein
MIRQLTDKEYKEYEEGKHEDWEIGWCYTCEQSQCKYRHDENINKPKLCDKFYFLG